MANRPDPNNPQPGDVFFNVMGDRRTIIARQDPWCWVAFDGSEPARTISTRYISKNWKPAPSTPPDRWLTGPEGTPLVLHHTRYISKNWKPAPSTPPDRWGVLHDDGEVWSYADRCAADVALSRYPRATLVHYVGTVVEP